LQLQHATPRRRLSAPGLAHEPERLAAPDLEADVVDRLDDGGLSSEETAAQVEVLHEVSYLEDDVARPAGHPEAPGLPRHRRGMLRRAIELVGEPARREVVRAHGLQPRRFGAAVFDGIRTARSEGAPTRHPAQIRRLARNRLELRSPRLVQPGDGT